MTGVILQPASGKEAQRHYKNTIEAPVAFSRIQPHVSSSFLEALTLSGVSDGICVWEAIPGNESKWNRLRKGDVVLFSRDSRFFSKAEVIAKTDSFFLANELSESNAKGDMWEFVYFITSPTPINISYKGMNANLGFDPDNNYQGMNVLYEKRSQQALDLLAVEEASLSTSLPSRP